MRLSIPVSAFVAAIVGFGGTLALIIAAAAAVGATRDQTASMVTALCLAMALETAWLSWRTRMPVITAWSTPGAALVGASSGYTINDAVGAFIVVALMLVATGLFRPLTRLISRIPSSVASAMLAGIVVTFAINAVRTIPADPVLILPLIAAFFVIRLFNPALSVLAVLIGGGIAAFALGRVGGLPAPELSVLVLTRPDFSLSAIVGLAVPLYLVTMASQNLSGLAVLKAAGYEPRGRTADRGHRPVLADHGAVQRADHQSRRDLGRHLHRPGRASRSRRALEDRTVLCARLSRLRHVRRVAGGDLRGAAAEPDRAGRRPRASGAARQRAVDRAQGRRRAHRRHGLFRRHGLGADAVRHRRRLLGPA